MNIATLMRYVRSSASEQSFGAQLELVTCNLFMPFLPIFPWPVRIFAMQFHIYICVNNIDSFQFRSGLQRKMKQFMNEKYRCFGRKLRAQTAQSSIPMRIMPEVEKNSVEGITRIEFDYKYFHFGQTKNGIFAMRHD